MKIAAKKALELINAGKSIDSYEVVVTESIDAMNAFHLRKNGVNVPEDLITYADEDLAFDEDIDNEDWQPLEGYVDETDWNVNVNLVVEKEVKHWLSKNNIEIAELLSSLLHSYYKADQLVHKR